jgi:ParB/RepB/Spo0J family partition protein
MRPESNSIIYIPWRRITPSPLNALVRGEAVTAEAGEEIKALAASILEVGILQPLAVKETGPDGRYELIVGQRRWSAAGYLGEQAPLLPCRLYPAMAELDQLVLMGAENLHRKNLSPIAEAKYYQNLLQRGMPLDRLIGRLNLSRSRVTGRLRLLELHPEVQQLIHTRSFPVSAAKHIRDLSPEAQAGLARKMAGRPVRDIVLAAGLVQKESDPAAGKIKTRGPAYKTRVAELKELLAKMAAQLLVTGRLLAQCAQSLADSEPDLAARAGTRARLIEQAVQKHIAAKKSGGIDNENNSS